MRATSSTRSHGSFRSGRPSEAARRFERGVDDQIQPAAAQMACELLEAYGSATASQSPQAAAHPVRRLARGIVAMHGARIEPVAADDTVDRVLVVDDYVDVMLEAYGSATASQSPRDVNNTKRRQPIVFKASEVKRIAGLDLDLNDISAILTDIGCTAAGGGNGEFSVVPPSWHSASSSATWRLCS